MRADNTRHLIAAARQRHELTRAKAIQALRTLDAAGAPVTFETVANQAGVSRSWLYIQRTCEQRSSSYGRHTAEHRRRRSRHGNAPPTPPSTAGSRPPPPRSADCDKKTTSSATSSPTRSGSAGPQPFVPPRAPVPAPP